MQVLARPKPRLAIVEVHPTEILEPDLLAKLAHGLRVGIVRADVVPRCKSMARVETDPNA